MKFNSLYTFAPDKSSGQFVEISPKKFILLKTLQSEFLYIEMRFTDENNKPLEM